MDEYIPKISNVARRCVNIYMKPVTPDIFGISPYKLLRYLCPKHKPRVYEINYLRLIISPFLKYIFACNNEEFAELRQFLADSNGITCFMEFLMNKKNKRILRSITKMFLNCECDYCTWISGEGMVYKGSIRCVYIGFHYVGDIIKIILTNDDFETAIMISEKCNVGFTFSIIHPDTLKNYDNPEMLQKLIKYYKNKYSADAG